MQTCDGKIVDEGSEIYFFFNVERYGCRAHECPLEYFSNDYVNSIRKDTIAKIQEKNDQHPNPYMWFKKSSSYMISSIFLFVDRNAAKKKYIDMMSLLKERALKHKSEQLQKILKKMKLQESKWDKALQKINKEIKVPSFTGVDKKKKPKKQNIESVTDGQVVLTSKRNIDID